MSSPVGALLVDARPVDHPTARQRGIGRYVAGLLRGLHEIDAPLVALYGSDLEAEVLAEAIPGLTLRRWSPQAVREHAAPGTWYVATQLMLHPIPLDPIPSVITRARLPVAAIMYDVIPYRFPERYQVDPAARRQAQVRASLAGTVDAMLAISRFSATTASDELAYPIERIATIGAGVESQFVPPSVRELPRPDRVLPASVTRYVVSVTGGDERKNTEGLLRAWGAVAPAVRASRHLVIATAHSPEVLRRWQRWAAEAGVADEVIFTGSITDDEMVATLQGAELAVMPSTEEGFGLPVVEAAACGVPVICSNVSSLPEVLDDPRAEFDPFDAAAIARAIERALTEPDHRDALRAAGDRATARWTWRRVAEDTVAALADLGPRWPQRVRSFAPRIAVAGPFAGSASGIAGYDEEVVAAIDRVGARMGGSGSNGQTPVVDVFVDGSATPQPTDTHADRRPVRAIGRFAKPWDFDHLVAVLGSSPHHVATAELAVHEPCHVWLHEASLVGVHVGLAHASGSEAWAKAYVASMLGPHDVELVASEGDAVLLDAPRLDELGVTMLDATLARARSVIVSSEAAAATVRRLRPGGPPLLVLPHAFPTVGTPRETPAGADVVAVGWVAANKAPELAVDVLERIGRSCDATVTFVGPTMEADEQRVRELAQARGLGDRLVFAGRLDGDAYTARLRAARVGMQLRLGHRGEMSGAIAGLVAAGTPTVTTLETASPSSPGLRVVDATVDDVVDAMLPLLEDDAAWSAASADAMARASRWTFDDVASALLGWLDDVDDLEPTAIRRCGPAAEASR